MQLINKHKGIRHLLCTINLFRKYSWVISLKDKEKLALSMHFKVLKDKNGVSIVNAFQSILDS